MDSGVFGRIKYNIRHVSNNGGTKFEIDENSGLIRVTDTVDRGEQYIITVEAEDQAPGKNVR